ncbi:MAG: ATP-binding protein, partial [Acidobacteriota bacterium]
TNPGQVAGDAERLQQIIWNLLSNAIKFTPRGGQVQVWLAGHDSNIQIKVKDTGQGIRPDFLPFVFERFRQANSSLTRTHGGLGLGLAVVRHLVELHGGSVIAESLGEGKGATFTVNLPLATNAIMTTSESPRRHQAGIGLVDSSILDGLSVLIVDDEPDARELLTFMLEQYGAQVIAVASAQEALALLDQQQPDVLLTDIGMPDEDGYTLIRKVRARAPENGGCIPAAALTAYARAEDRVRALSEGFQMHVAKPIDPDQLTITVASLAGRTVNA